MRKTGLLQWYGEKLTDQFTFISSTRSPQNKISALDPHLYELCKVCQDLSVSHLSRSLCLFFHILSISSMQEWRGQNILGWQLSMAWGLCESQSLSERQMSCDYIWEQEVILHSTPEEHFSMLQQFGFFDLLPISSLLSPPILPLLLPQPICVQSLRKKNNSVVNLGQGSSLAEEATPHDVSASLRQGSKIWPQFQISQRKVEG